MRKNVAFIIAICVVVLFLSACGEKANGPKGGSASMNEMLKFLPMNSQAVFYVDLQKAMSLETVDQALQSEESYKKLQEFITKTGIDPKKDIHYIIGSLTSLEQSGENGALIANLNYNKDTVLNLIKEEAESEVLESEYSGLTLYSTEVEGEMGSFCFLDESNILFGNVGAVKSVVDVVKNNADNLTKNKDLFDLIGQTKKDALIWATFVIPAETMGKATSGNPMLGSLESIRAASLFFDYENNNFVAEIKLLSADAEKNKQVADLLNSLKALGSMGASDKPEIGELVNKIEITSGEDHVKIYASIPEDLINKLKEGLGTPEIN